MEVVFGPVAAAALLPSTPLMVYWYQVLLAWCCKVRNSKLNDLAKFWNSLISGLRWAQVVPGRPDTLQDVWRCSCVFVSRGAGQEVGRSCIILEFKGRKILVRCVTWVKKDASLHRFVKCCLLWFSWTVESILVWREWTRCHTLTWSIRLKSTCCSSASEFLSVSGSSFGHIPRVCICSQLFFLTLVVLGRL